jgi:DNA-binding CsgD family transcriptional regulator
VEILRPIALGHSNSEIGEQLYLSVRTVESHRAHIQRKTSRSTLAELVRYALDHGLIEPVSRLGARADLIEVGVLDGDRHPPRED